MCLSKAKLLAVLHNLLKVLKSPLVEQERADSDSFRQARVLGRRRSRSPCTSLSLTPRLSLFFGSIIITAIERRMQLSVGLAGRAAARQQRLCLDNPRLFLPAQLKAKSLLVERGPPTEGEKQTFKRPAKQ